MEINTLSRRDLDKSFYKGFKKVNHVDVRIGELEFRLSESVTGALTINKSSSMENGRLVVYPEYSNQIEIK